MLEMPNCLQMGATSAVVTSKAMVSDLAPFMKVERPVSKAETMPASDEGTDASMDPPRGIREMAFGKVSRWGLVGIAGWWDSAVGFGWKARDSVHVVSMAVVAARKSRDLMIMVEVFFGQVPMRSADGFPLTPYRTLSMMSFMFTAGITSTYNDVDVSLLKPVALK